jgi:hypothetical protein
MNLRPDQQLFLHSILFHYLNLDCIDRHIKHNVQELIDEVADSLLSSHDKTRQKDDWCITDDYDDDEEEDDDSSVPSLSIGDILTLPDCKAKLSDGTSGKIIFFGDKRLQLEFDNFQDGCLVSVAHVASIVRRGNELTIFDPYNEKWTFKISKFPKEWTSLIDVNVHYEVRSK